jgi:hypothetical protein
MGPGGFPHHPEIGQQVVPVTRAEEGIDAVTACDRTRVLQLEAPMNIGRQSGNSRCADDAQQEDQRGAPHEPITLLQVRHAVRRR